MSISLQERGTGDTRSEAKMAFLPKGLNNAAEASSVPWIDWYEFRAVGDALLSATTFEPTKTTNVIQEDSTTADDVEHNSLTLEDALKRVDAWKNRSSKPLPASVESTGALALALWRERESSSVRHPSIVQSECRMLYSTAIIRTINGLADPFQQNRSFASSVADICSQIGVPLWLVEVRHEATHNQMPSLSTLRNSAITLLNYLNSVYWDPLNQIRNQAAAQIRTCLDDYMNAVESEEAEERSVETSVVQSIARSPATYTRDEGFFDFGEDDSHEDKGGPIPPTRLGTNSNMFAVLMEEKKKKKPKAKDIENKVAEPEPKQKKQTVRSQVYFVKRLLNLCVPLDVVWDTTINHLLTSSLVPQSSKDFPCSEQSVLKLQKRLQCLLSALGKMWPGVIVALLNAIIDHLFVSCADPDRTTEVYFLKSWVNYFVSRAFFATIGKVMKVQGTLSQCTPAPTDELRSFGYPLSSLCDRLESYCLSHSVTTGNAIHTLKCLFIKLLRNAGETKSRFNPDTNSAVDPLSCNPVLEKIGGASTSTSFSLDQMEKMLAEEGLDTDDNPAPENDSKLVEVDATDCPGAW
eukprot:CAMPEP_0168763912 /NCGR_PEP_ID=MMETSP0724-20121128/24608_1 /TAXON_ID=265536 /ORGANISM="Amphiprora sp., Strain CCMP467" /LENGTH=579 /DNA_ID=CAMNT_0008813131 /DNA_START=74 /DNA_END=1811 /DNA_ORIENTATION=-